MAGPPLRDLWRSLPTRTRDSLCTRSYVSLVKTDALGARLVGPAAIPEGAGPRCPGSGARRDDVPSEPLTAAEPDARSRQEEGGCRIPAACDAMADPIVISDISDAETEADHGSPINISKNSKDIIDLTEDDSCCTVIDLTMPERMDGSVLSDDTGVELDSEPFHAGECSYLAGGDLHIKDEIHEKSGGVSDVRLQTGRYTLDIDCKQKANLSPRSVSSSDCNESSSGLSLFSLELSSSRTMLNSDMGSLESLQLEGASSSSPNIHTSQDLPPLDLQDLASKNCGANSVTLQNSSPLPCQHRQCPSVLDPSSSLRSTQQLSLGVDSKGAIPELDLVGSPKRCPSNRAWLNKLKYFCNPPVQHLFFQDLKADAEIRKCQQSKPIPERRLNMVTSTIEENFPQGTLQFLSDFVSLQHYPPKEIVSHVINKIMLGLHGPDILMDAYMLLMKIQRFHPANASTVKWDWKLVSNVMEKMDAFPSQLLFLQYVIQTLEDDFQANLRRRTLQKSIAKSVLSCDNHFSNVRDVIQWLVNAVKFSSLEVSEVQPGPSLLPITDSTRSKTQSLVCLLQRMLSIAVEVDKSPTCSSNKIADAMFPFLLSIPKRCQRETLFNSMESPLLRAKVIDIMFDHSCEPLLSPSLPLSLAKILYFVKHSTLLLEDQDSSGDWQRWDEILHHLCLLFLSYQRIVTEHLRTCVTERIDLIIRKSKPQLTQHDNISTQDVELHLAAFCSRVSQLQGETLLAPLQMRIHVLRTLLSMATSQNKQANC